MGIKILLNIMNTRVLCLTGVLLLLVSVFPTAALAFSQPEYLRVGLYYSSTALSECEIAAEEGFILGIAEDDGFTETLPLPAYTVLFATVEDNNVVLRDEDGVLISADIGTNGCLMPADYEDGGTITIQSAQYRGGVAFKAANGDKLTIMNYVRLEEYLYGVIHLEMSQGNPMEALKAQAVTARSFAVANLGKHSDYGFDVCNSTNCQVYGGCSAEYTSTIQAVDETAGLLIRYAGEPVAVYYYKNSGGHTQSVEDVWTYPLAYLTGVTDPYSPDYPWTATLDFDTIAQKLSLAGYDVGDVKSVEISERNSSGAVAKLTVTGSEDEVTLEKEKIRTVFGTAVIKSRMFSFGTSYTGGSADTASVYLAGSTQATAKADDTVYVLGSSGTAEVRETDSIYLTNGTTTTKAVASGTSDSGTEIDTDGVLELSGMGYGHGVGMPQDGAIQMAKEGFTFDEILKYYFSGIEIE